jgi:hypothetical protein
MGIARVWSWKAGVLGSKRVQHTLPEIDSGLLKYTDKNGTGNAWQGYTLTALTWDPNDPVIDWAKARERSRLQL